MSFCCCCWLHSGWTYLPDFITAAQPTKATTSVIIIVVVVVIIVIIIVIIIGSSSNNSSLGSIIEHIQQNQRQHRIAFQN
jgi:threonine/homoserine/homoserine lactone efflux protein